MGLLLSLGKIHEKAFNLANLQKQNVFFWPRLMRVPYTFYMKCDWVTYFPVIPVNVGKFYEFEIPHVKTLMLQKQRFQDLDKTAEIQANFGCYFIPLLLFKNSGEVRVFS